MAQQFAEQTVRFLGLYLETRVTEDINKRFAQHLRSFLPTHFLGMSKQPFRECKPYYACPVDICHVTDYNRMCDQDLR